MTRIFSIVLKDKFLKATVPICQSLMKMATEINSETAVVQEISEGLARIKTGGKVFYNPVQEFNRDLRWVSCSISYQIQRMLYKTNGLNLSWE